MGRWVTGRRLGGVSGARPRTAGGGVIAGALCGHEARGITGRAGFLIGGGEEDLIKRWSNHSPNLFIIRLFSRRPLYCASPTHFIISSPLRDFFSSSARAPLSLLFLPLPFPPLLVGVITLRLSSRLVAPTPLSLSLFSVRGSRSLCA